MRKGRRKEKQCMGMMECRSAYVPRSRDKYNTMTKSKENVGTASSDDDSASLVRLRDQGS